MDAFVRGYVAAWEFRESIREIQAIAGHAQEELDKLREGILAMATVKWAEMTPEQRDRFIYEHVMGQTLSCSGQAVTHQIRNPSRIPGEYFEYPAWSCATCGRQGSGTAPEHHEVVRVIPPYTTSMAAAWLLVEKMLARQEEEYYFKHFEWDGPTFKPSHRYLTSEGYPLGTTCWYVRIRVNDLIEFVCAMTPQDAICLAALKVAGIEVEV